MKTKRKAFKYVLIEENKISNIFLSYYSSIIFEKRDHS